MQILFRLSWSAQGRESRSSLKRTCYLFLAPLPVLLLVLINLLHLVHWLYVGPGKNIIASARLLHHCWEIEKGTWGWSQGAKLKVFWILKARYGIMLYVVRFGTGKKKNLLKVCIQKAYHSYLGKKKAWQLGINSPGQNLEGLL